MSPRWFSLCLVGCAAASTPAPTPPTARPAEARINPEPTPEPPLSDTAAQAALTEQYEVGKTIYVRNKCASCHGEHGEGNPKNPPVIGPAALPATAPPAAKLRRNVTFTTAGDVLAFVRARMPLNEPGTLTDDEAAAVTSWMLSESKVELARPLTGANAGSIRLR